MHPLTSSLIAIALIGGLPIQADANTFELGTLGSTPVVGNVMPLAGSFSDIFNFSVASPNTLVAGATMNAPMSFGSGTVFNISNLSATLYGDINANGTLIGTLSGNYISYSDVLPVGNYSVKITGVATGLAGGSYTYTAFAQAVPEPESYAMFLAGLGVMCFIARRRQST